MAEALFRTFTNARGVNCLRRVVIDGRLLAMDIERRTAGVLGLPNSGRMVFDE